MTKKYLTAHLVVGSARHDYLLGMIVHHIAVLGTVPDIVIFDPAYLEKEITLPPCDPIDILPVQEKTYKGGVNLWRSDKKKRKTITPVPIRQGNFFQDQRRGYRGFRRF